jgi:fumarate reductase flavoprotein subunit
MKVPAETMMRDAYDVVVVGGGGTGLAAAIAAREAGRSVALLEKNPELGGTTALSVGSITATATPHQVAAGIKDRPEDHFADMPGFAGELASRDNLVLRRLLVENVPETFRWLVRLGVVFYGPMPEPPHRKPRMHNVLPNSRAYIYSLGRHARRAGVEMQTGVRARELVRDGARVVGLRAEIDGRERTIGARGGVVLASGDYAASGQLKARFMAPEIAKVDPINEASTGDGQAMGLAVGGRVVNGDLALGPEIRFVPPPQDTLVRRLPPWRTLARLMAWSMDTMPQAILRPFVMSFVTTWLAPSLALYEHGAVLVNKTGARFTDELASPALALPDQPDKVGYILLDKRVADLFSAWPHFISTAPGLAYAFLADYRRNRRDIYHQDRTLAGLAGKLGMDAAVLERTVAEHNASGRPSIESPPFTALGPVRSSIIIVEGGLAVNERLQVLGEGDRPIPGLYAGGSAGQGGLLLEGHGHHLGWAFTSGRIAGRNAAYEVVSEDLD